MNERRRGNYCSFRQLKKKVEMAEAGSCERCRANGEQINLSLSSATSSISVNAGRAWGPHPGSLMDTSSRAGFLLHGRGGTVPEVRGLSAAPRCRARGAAPLEKGAVLVSRAQPSLGPAVWLCLLLAVPTEAPPGMAPSLHSDEPTWARWLQVPVPGRGLRWLIPRGPSQPCGPCGSAESRPIPCPLCPQRLHGSEPAASCQAGWHQLFHLLCQAFPFLPSSFPALRAAAHQRGPLLPLLLGAMRMLAVPGGEQQEEEEEEAALGSGARYAKAGAGPAPLAPSPPGRAVPGAGLQLPACPAGSREPGSGWGPHGRGHGVASGPAGGGAAAAGAPGDRVLHRP